MRLSFCELCERRIRGSYEIVAGDVVCEDCLNTEVRCVALDQAACGDDQAHQV